MYAEGPARRLVRVAAQNPALSVGVVAIVALAAAGAFIASLVQREQQAVHHARVMEGMKTVLVAVGDRNEPSLLLPHLPGYLLTP